MDFVEIILNESGQIDLLKIDSIDQHISVKKSAIEQEYEAARKERKEKKKNKQMQKKDYKD